MVFATFNQNNKEYVYIFKKNTNPKKQIIQLNYNVSSSGVYDCAFCYDVEAKERGKGKTK